MTPQHSANCVSAKRRKRLESPPADYESDIDYSKPSHQIVIRNCHTGETHVLTLHISRQRIDQFKVLVDGELWKERIGMSRILAGVRKSLPRFSRFT